MVAWSWFAFGFRTIQRRGRFLKAVNNSQFPSSCFYLDLILAILIFFYRFVHYLSDRPRVVRAYLRLLLANICTDHGRDSPWEVNSDCITTIFCSDFSLNVSGHWGRQAPNGESNINKNAVCRTGETRYSDWGESTHGRRSNEAGAGSVRIHPHIQLLYPNSYGRALTFIFSPSFFFNPLPFRSLRLLIFQCRLAHRKLHVVIGHFVKVEPLPYFEVCILNIPYQISSPLVFNFSYIDLCSVSQFSCFSENLPSDLSPGQCLGKNKWTKETYHRLWLQAMDNVTNVSRNDFRLPPQVESSVIRLVPLDPPPPVEFEEFDGMNRVIFSRPNKRFEAISRLKESWRC